MVIEDQTHIIGAGSNFFIAVKQNNIQPDKQLHFGQRKNAP